MAERTECLHGTPYRYSCDECDEEFNPSNKLMKKYATANFHSEWYVTAKVEDVEDIEKEPNMKSEDAAAVLWSVVQGAELGDYHPLEVSVRISSDSASIRLLSRLKSAEVMSKAKLLGANKVLGPTKAGDEDGCLASVRVSISDLELTINSDFGREKFNLNDPRSIKSASQEINNVLNEVLRQRNRVAEVITNSMPSKFRPSVDEQKEMEYKMGMDMSEGSDSSY